MQLVEEERLIHRQKPVKVKAKVRGEHSIGNVLTSPLIPFRRSMIVQLNRRGFNTSSLDWKTLVSLYYNEFVSNKENTKNPYVPISSYEFKNNPAFRLRPSDSFNGEIIDYRNSEYFEDIKLKVVIWFIKSLGTLQESKFCELT